MWSSRLCRSWARWICARFCMRRTSSADAGLHRPLELPSFWSFAVCFAQPACVSAVPGTPSHEERSRFQDTWAHLLSTRQNLLCRGRLCALPFPVWCCCAIDLLHAEVLPMPAAHLHH